MKTGLKNSVSYLFQIPSLFRFPNWWHYKIPVLIGIFFCGAILTQHHTYLQILTTLLLLIVWMLATAALGYFLNDWTDIHEDYLAGKENAVVALPVIVRWVTCILLVFVSLYIQYELNGLRSIQLGLSIVQIFLFTLYSTPPLRLKRFLVTGTFCDSLYAHVVPAIIVFTTAFRGGNSYLFETAILCGWMFILGLKNILLHHVFDRKKDGLSKTTNAANKFGAVYVLEIVNRILLPLDMFIGLLFTSVISFELMCLVFAMFCFRFFLTRTVWGNRKILLNKTFAYLVSNNVYEGYLPLFAAFLLFHHNPLILLSVNFVYLFIFPKFTKSVTHDVKSLFNYLR